MARPYDDTLELMSRGVAKVVEANDVEYLTREGWRIAKVLPESRMELANEQVPLMPPGQSYPTQASGTRGLVVGFHRFLMFFDEKSALAKFATEAKQRHIELCDMRTALTAAQSDLKLQTAEAKKAETLRAAATAENASLSQRYYDERKLKQKMEEDIAKIRKAVGEMKMKEILATP